MEKLLWLLTGTTMLSRKQSASVGGGYNSPTEIRHCSLDSKYFTSQHRAGMVARADSPSYLGGWGRKITWAQKSRACLSNIARLSPPTKKYPQNGMFCTSRVSGLGSQRWMRCRKRLPLSGHKWPPSSCFLQLLQVFLSAFVTLLLGRIKAAAMT
jgi:hypothetical protein